MHSLVRPCHCLPQRTYGREHNKERISVRLRKISTIARGRSRAGLPALPFGEKRQGSGNRRLCRLPPRVGCGRPGVHAVLPGAASGQGQAAMIVPIPAADNARVSMEACPSIRGSKSDGRPNRYPAGRHGQLGLRAIRETSATSPATNTTNQTGEPGIHLTQVTPTSCSWAHSVLASQSATIERYGVGSTAMACCTRR